MVDLSVVILSYNTKNITLSCLTSIYKSKTSYSFEVLVVDNASGDDSVKAIKQEFPQLKLIESKVNLGFTGGNNLGIKHSNGKYVLLLNSDTEVFSNSLENLLQYAEQNRADILACKLVYPDGTFQPNGGELPTLFPLFSWLSGIDDIFRRFYRLPSYQERSNRYYQNGKGMGWVSGAVMLISKQVIDTIGGLDDQIFMYGEDVDYCWRAKQAGFKVVWTDEAVVMHIGGASSPNPRFNQWKGEFLGLLYLYNKYYGRLGAGILRLFIILFIVLRMLIFILLGRINYAQTYGTILKHL